MEDNQNGTFPKTIDLGEYKFEFLTAVEVKRDKSGKVMAKTTEQVTLKEDNKEYYDGIYCTFDEDTKNKIEEQKKNDFPGYYFFLTEENKFLHGVSLSEQSVLGNILQINKEGNFEGCITKKNGVSTYMRLNILICIEKINGHKVAIYRCKRDIPTDSNKQNEKRKYINKMLEDAGYEKSDFNLKQDSWEAFVEDKNELGSYKNIARKSDFPPHYQWIEYFKNLTDKILAYKDNRDEFKNKVISVLSEYSNIGNYEKSGIDPLSFIYELSRLWGKKEKNTIYSKVAEEFEIKCNLNNIDKWIFTHPHISNMKIFFYSGDTLENNDIHWNIFISAKNDEFITEKDFNEILKVQYVTIKKLTEVLSIIECKKYIAYNENISKKYNLQKYTSENESQFLNYTEYIKKIRQLFPQCSLYETSAFIKITEDGKAHNNNLHRQIYQISSYMENGVNGKKDHTEYFYNQSAVYVDDKESGSGILYPISEPKNNDIIIARYGDNINGIGIIIDNEYNDNIFTPDKRIYVIWLNKEPFDSILSRQQDLALKKMSEQDIEKCKKVYGETFEMLGINNEENNKFDQQCKDIEQLLKFKKQVILQGAPGTGKTYTAKKVAKDMKCSYDIVQFHPSYTYEDFVRGIVAETDNNGNISYKVVDKILMEAVEKANKLAEENKKHILIIDEINRANLPSVLGELLYALEYRGEPVKCPYKDNGKDNGDEIRIPDNLYIIGTMNTADRSIGSIDYAVRRRFAFYTVISDENLIEDEYSKKVYEYVKEIIDTYISEEYNKDDIMVGHSYFMFEKTEMDLSLRYNIIPLLEEYYKDGILIDKSDKKVQERIGELKEVKSLDDINDLLEKYDENRNDKADNNQKISETIENDEEVTE